MLKKRVVGFLLAGWVIHVQAQETGTLLEQLAALRGYIVTTEKGYRLVEEGLHTIGGIRRDEFSLHSSYFASLSNVNPAVKNNPSIAVIVQLETGMMNQFAGALVRWRSSPWLQVAEIRGIQGVYANLVRVGTDNLIRLQSLVGDSVYTLTDGERMRAIGKIAATVKEQAEGVSGYIRGTDVLIAWRQREHEETLLLQKWIGNF